MLEKNSQALLQQALELLDTACQGSLELLRCWSDGKPDEAVQLIQDLRVVTQSISDTGLASQLERACAAEMLENIECTLDEIEGAFQAGSTDRAAMKTEFQLFPFLRQLKESLYFWGAIYPDREEMERYYQKEFAPHNCNLYVDENGESPVRLSVVVAGYNHLDTTRGCIQQLLKETDFDRLQAELILIDHGSSDGTLEYFESLGIGKVIHFKKNVRMYMFSMLSQICLGKYFAFVSNDILVTRNWADILMTCLESDSKIIAAVPATPNIANLQMLNSPTNDPEEFIRWADGQNKSDPSRWNDRARLMPPVGMYRTSLVSKIGLADPYFYSMEFWDDDFSLRARRAGYRQIVCSDVACYHFGSVTGKEAQKKEGTLVYGRELFQQKHGVDAWGSGFCYDYHAIQIFQQIFSSRENQAVLCLDCGMGDTPLQIKNELRHLHRTCELYQLTSQRIYLPDLEPHSQAAAFVPDLAEGINARFDTKQFDLAYLGRELSQYEDGISLLDAVSHRLIPGGWFVFTCGNPFYAPILHALLHFSLPQGNGRITLADPEQLRSEAEKHFSQVQMVPVENPVQGVEAFAAQLYGRTKRPPDLARRLNTQNYIFVCRK